MSDKLTVNHPARRVFRFIESCSLEGAWTNDSSYDERFNELALELFAYQFEYNESYRKFCELRNTAPGGFASWQRIPTVPTTAFKEFEMSCLQPELRTHVFHSSGTTSQKPSRHFHNVASLEIYNASLKSPFLRNVLSNASYCQREILSLTPRSSSATHSSLAHMFHVVTDEFGSANSEFAGRVAPDGSWELDVEKLSTWINERIDANVPSLLLGTAFNFVHLIDHLLKSDTRLRLPEGSAVMETGGYKGRSREMPKEELHRLITEELDVPATHIVCEYGMSELSSQAYDHVVAEEAERRFTFPPWARVRIVSPETGQEVRDEETGLIQVFDLANAFSVLAIQTEDLAVKHGNGFELIGRATAAEPRGCSLTSL
jgi:hypothetical protein